MTSFSFDAADSKLMDFLKQEIQHEKSAASSVPSSMLFEVTSFCAYGLAVMQNVIKVVFLSE